MQTSMIHSLLFLKYIEWHFIAAPKEILKGWGNILWFGFNYFSVPLLLKTLFAPWRRITWSYGRGFDPGRYLFIFSSNLISRILGAIMRTFLIVAGIGLGLCLVVLGGTFFVFWFLLPALIAIAFMYGIFLLF